MLNIQLIKYMEIDPAQDGMTKLEVLSSKDMIHELFRLILFKTKIKYQIHNTYQSGMFGRSKLYEKSEGLNSEL